MTSTRTAKGFRSVPFASALALALVLTGATVATATATAGTPNQVLGAVVLGLTSAGAGTALGVVIRARRRRPWR